jgi:serine/threonine-protein kinase
VNRTSFPAGQVSASFAKAILMQLDAGEGAAAADAWLRSIHMLRDDLDDETRLIPLLTLHDALVAFVETRSREALSGTWRWLIAPENLGTWVRVLRGTSSPTDAFARLDATDSEYTRSVRWETTSAGPGFWKGRVVLLHDPTVEEDGLLVLARTAQLAAVPALFGFEPAKVIAKGTTGSAKTGIAQEYEVTWPVPRSLRTSVSGAAAGGVLGGAGIALGVPIPGEILAIAAGLVGGAIVGAAIARDRQRRAESLAQSMRVRVLERNLTLKESRDRAAAGQLEGSVVAGQYRIRERMGSGASGVIYEATRVRDGLPVAIKLLRAAAAHDAIASDRLRREAEALGLAWHPNVVEVIDHGYLPDGTAFLVMELLRGESLAVRLKSRGRLTPAELKTIAVQVCDALSAVHAAGIVHRDLKPSNIFLERRARDGRAEADERVKLLDFGIARVEWEETRITNLGAPVGTPGYMSPEQEIGGEVDARSDLFAVGAIVYECLVGEPPPPTPSGMWLAGPEKGQAHREEQVEEGLRALPQAWQTIIERALAPVPRDRFQDARAFGQALRDIDAEPSAQASS